MAWAFSYAFIVDEAGKARAPAVVVTEASNPLRPDPADHEANGEAGAAAGATTGVSAGARDARPAGESRREGPDEGADEGPDDGEGHFAPGGKLAAGDRDGDRDGDSERGTERAAKGEVELIVTGGPVDRSDDRDDGEEAELGVANSNRKRPKRGYAPVEASVPEGGLMSAAPARNTPKPTLLRVWRVRVSACHSAFWPI